MTDRIEQILNDPERIKQIMEMASSLGLQDPTQNVAQPLPELTENITTVLQQLRFKDQKQENLIHALLPYLKPGKQRRLERAMRIAQLSQFAGAAIATGGGPVLQEGDQHV